MLEDSKGIKNPFSALFRFPYFLGVLGILLIPMDSSPFFPVNSDNRPFWTLPFSFLFIMVLLLRQKISMFMILLGLLIGFVIIQSFFQYQFFGYENLKGFYKGTFVLIVMFFTVGGIDLFIKYIISELGVESLMPTLARLILASTILPVLAGILQLLYIFGFPLLTVAQKFTRFFSYRFSYGRLQLISGEPSWAAIYLIFAGIFIAMFYPGRRVKIVILPILVVLFLFTGSTIGYVFIFIIAIIYLLLYFNFIKLLFLSIFVLLSGSVIALNIYPLLSPYTQTKIAIVISLLENLSFKNILEIASKDWSFMARFMNPVIAFKLSYENYFLGNGLDSFQYVIVKELIRLDFLETLSAEDIHLIQISGSTPKSFFAKILYENGLLVWVMIIIFNLRLLVAFLNEKRFMLLLFVSYVLVLNDDSYLSYTYLLTILIVYNLHQNKYAR